MLAKEIEFKDFNGNMRKETFLFNLTQAEVMELELSTMGGLAESIQRIVEAQDGPEIIRIFKSLILKAYGVKSPDGRRFIKSEELSTEFSQTNAYSKLFMELATNDEVAAAFVNGIVPEDMAETANQPALAPVN